MSKVVVNLRLDKGLVERIDAAAGPRGRTKLIVAAVEARLASKRRENPLPASPPEGFAVSEGKSADRVAPVAGFVRARSLVTPEIQSEWAEIMAARQRRLNKKRDDAA
jgi:hypothetical protein